MREPVLADFAVQGAPQFVADTSDDDASFKPVMMYLPGIELTGYSLHRQVDDLRADFDVRWLAVPTEDRTNFTSLVEVVVAAVEAEHSASGRQVYLAGESFGGVLALAVALHGDGAKPPPGLAGLVLINPATAVTRSWPARLPALLDAIAGLPAGLSDAAYQAIATPIFAGISGDPIQLGSRRSDASLPLPLRVPTVLGRLAAQAPELGALPAALPLPTLAFRLSMLIEAAEAAQDLKLSALKLPVQVYASTDDRVLPSADEARRLARALPNAKVTLLEQSGHVPLLEGRVDLSARLRKDALLLRQPLSRAKDFVADWVPPSDEAYENATRSLAGVRKVTSPVFLSTQADGSRVRGLSALPPLDGTDGAPPALMVGNHQLYGFLDLPLVVQEIQRETGTLVRALAHPVAFRSGSADEGLGGDGGGGGGGGGGGRGGGGGGGFVDFETFGAVPVSPRALFKLLKRGESTLLYPGGVREAFKSLKQGERYQLFWPDAAESSDFVPVAARFGASIIAVAAIGAEEGFEMVLDADELLRLPVVGERVAESAKRTPVGRMGERFVAPVSAPKLPGRFYFLFGAPIDTRGIDPNDKEACAALYTKVQRQLEDDLEYLLAQRQRDPYEAPLPRVAVEATWNWTKQAPSFSL